MEQCLFSIENLVCSYDNTPESRVLSIDRLQIPGGKLVFLLGSSGCGKSTLLETLGLMNNTIVSGTIFLNPGSIPDEINLSHLWRRETPEQLTEVRKKYYSFIFQNTNLMENFTAYENVCLSGMIKENVPQSKVLESAKVLMNKIRLPENEVGLQTLAVNLSGGQRQRLAFARALNNNAIILFGDEPTGNLDEANANELFEIIRANLNNNFSAIVVSHDINLAVKYADQIIIITKEPGKSYGEVKEENIFDREIWQTYSPVELNSFKERLRVFYKTDNEHKPGKAKVTIESDTSVKYSELFLKKEGRALLGKNYSNFIILSLILTFTFLAIGFANGSLDYLNKQLKDAFVNWIPINIPSSAGQKLEDLQYELKEDSIKNRFLIGNATPYRRGYVSVWDVSKKSFQLANARTVDVGEDAELIKGVVLKDNNVIHGQPSLGFKDENDMAVIVTKNFLDEFGYPDDANFVYFSFTKKDTISHTALDIPVKIPVRAIVKRLPGKYGMIYPLYFWQTLPGYGKDNIFDSTTRVNNFCFFLETYDKGKALEFGNDLKKFVDEDRLLSPYHPKLYLWQGEPDTIGFKAGYRFEIGFDSSVTNLPLLNGLIGRIKQNEKERFDTGSIFRFFDYTGVTEKLESSKYDDLSVYFEKLDSIAAFKDYLYARADLKNNANAIVMDDGKVKEKENYLFLSKVTNIISTLLVIFSTLAVCLFIFNLLKSHLSKVKMNIGTFKAIGLTDKESQSIYFKIIIFFIAASAAVSFLLAAIFGNIINLAFAGPKGQDDNINYFKLLDFTEPGSTVNYITLLTIAIVFFSTALMSRQTIRGILSKTPGDLIYNR